MSFAAAHRHAVATLAIAMLGGCASSILPAPSAPPDLYTLDAPARSAPPARHPAASPSAPTLVVDMPRSAPGFDTARIAYTRRALEIDYFAHSRWVDAPARMLTPSMVRALEDTGAFHAVLAAPSTASGSLRLESEVVRLQQDFSVVPSEVRFTLRAALIDGATRRVIASGEFDSRVTARSDDPYGGVVAARRASEDVLGQLAAFCAAHAGS